MKYFPHPSFTRLLALACLAAASFAASAVQIVVGQVAPLTGPEGGQARAYSVGIQMALTRAGTVNGHTFALVSKDTVSAAPETLVATTALLSESRPLVLAGYFGDASVQAVVGSGLLEKERIVLLGYRVNEVTAESPQLYNVRASLRDEVSRIIEHLATIGITRIGLFHPSGPGAAPLLKVMDDAVKSKGIKLIAKGSYEPNTTRVADALIDSFITASPQAIVLVSSGSAAAAFVEKYRQSGGAAQLFTHSGADVEQMSKRLGEEQMKGIAIAQVTPNPYKISVRLSREFNEVVGKTPSLPVPVSYAMMEGYIAGSVIVEATRRMGARVSREAFQNALDSIDNLDLGGYKIGYKPGAHSGSRFVELTIITEAGRIRQ